MVVYKAYLIEEKFNIANLLAEIVARLSKPACLLKLHYASFRGICPYTKG